MNEAYDMGGWHGVFCLIDCWFIVFAGAVVQYNAGASQAWFFDC
jgi:hypothetical protein